MKTKQILLGSISITYDLWLPYSSVCLMSYALHYADVYSISFQEPLYKWLPDDVMTQRLLDIDLLALTCYVWNQEYNHHIAFLYKQINPNGTVIFGGPNVPLDPELYEETAATYSYVDAFLAGPGEAIFCEILKNLDKSYQTWKGCYGKGFNNVVTKPAQIPASRMPQPYLDGLFDSILTRESRIKASFETNRGCPFKCAFCDWGGQANNKVIKFPVDAVHSTIDYIYSWPSVSEIEILDANFGMQKRDLETLQHMLIAKEKTGNNPTVSYSGLVKNGSPYLLDIIDIIHNKLGAERRHLKLSFQTHTQSTLSVMLRDNIRNERLLSLLDELRAKNIDVSSEMIIGMPGETASSWLDSQSIDYDNGIAFMRTYLLSLVCNTRLYEKEFRDKHSIQSKRLLLPYEMRQVNRVDFLHNPNLTVSHGNAYESVELIHRCYSFDMDELVLMFRYFWYYHNFQNSRAFNRTIAHLHARGYGIRAQTIKFFDNIPTGGIFANMISRHDALVSRIFSDQSITVIDDYATYRFVSGSLRTDDLLIMIRNKDQIAAEMQLIFGDWCVNNRVIQEDIHEWLDPVSDEKFLTSRLFNMGSSIK